MPPVGFRSSARTVSLALVAGFVALEAFLALRTGAAGIPGVFLVRFGDESGAAIGEDAKRQDGGESVVAKLPNVAEAPKPAPEETTGSVSPDNGMPRLEGLSDIPLKPWVSDEEDSKPARSKIAAAGLQGGEELPWDAVEPVPFDATKPVPSESPQAASKKKRPVSRLTALPTDSEVTGWVKAKATEVKGQDRARPFYHFEFWLEPPQEVTQELATVAYEFNTPAVVPQAQISDEDKTGFRISAGGLICADRVKVTLRFRDGRSQRVEVDSCKLLG
jgi:hypothetical protein